MESKDPIEFGEISLSAKKNEQLNQFQKELSTTQTERLISIAESLDISCEDILIGVLSVIIEKWKICHQVFWPKEEFMSRDIPWGKLFRQRSQHLRTKAESTEKGNVVGRFDLSGDKETIEILASEKLVFGCVKHDNALCLLWKVKGNDKPMVYWKAAFNAQVELIEFILNNKDEFLPDCCPADQLKIRSEVNGEIKEPTDVTLHENFFQTALSNPELVAVLWRQKDAMLMMSYGELRENVLVLAGRLVAEGVAGGDLVAITLPRGVDQVIAVLATLAAGAAYVPIGVNQPAERRQKIYKKAAIKYAIINDESDVEAQDDMTFINLSLPFESVPLTDLVEVKSDALAYVVFTSGSTGEPKGVEITHRAAFNTIEDINNKFNITFSDRGLALSALDFDLSVYDIFGLLSAGASLVLLSEKTAKEAQEWHYLVQRTKVTIWNSVPAILDMLLVSIPANEMLDSLQNVMVSGDWVGLDLYERLKEKAPDTSFIAMGGATEASIWSNYFEVSYIDPEWSSVPYGKPLSNQQFRVVNEWGENCPDYVEGELWIGGAGVANGYLGQKDLTSDRFLNIGGVRWYRTGDLGQYWSDGTLEFLGRKDSQVKLRGYRIELGEIEAALRSFNGVDRSIATTTNQHEGRHLIAAVEAKVDIGSKDSLSGTTSKETLISRAKSRKDQAAIVKAFLIKLFQLKQIHEGSLFSPFGSMTIASEFKPVVHSWLNWLVEHKILEYAKKDEYKVLNESIKSLDVFQEDLSDDLTLFKSALISKVEDYRTILEGHKSVNVLLDDPVLSPEKMAAKDPGTLAGLSQIAHLMKQKIEESDRPLELAFLGCRTGVIPSVFLKLIPTDNIRVTMIDSANSMLVLAEENLRNSGHQIEFVKLPENHVTAPFRYKFDVVLGINVLHRYQNPKIGINILNMLLEPKGEVHILEHAELSALALVTSAFIDKGYTDYDLVNTKAKESPMLTGNEWVELIEKSSLDHICYSDIERTFTSHISAKPSSNRIMLYEKQLVAHLQGRLPAHMIPERIELLPQFPLTSNGKVNRKSIEDYFEFSTLIEDDELPQEGMETEIANIWKSLLKIDKVGRNQGFFQVGGDSLLATRLLAEVKQNYGVELSLREMFDASTLKDVAATMEEKLNEQNLAHELIEEGEI